MHCRFVGRPRRLGPRRLCLLMCQRLMLRIERGIVSPSPSRSIVLGINSLRSTTREWIVADMLSTVIGPPAWYEVLHHNWCRAKCSLDVKERLTNPCICRQHLFVPEDKTKIRCRAMLTTSFVKFRMVSMSRLSEEKSIAPCKILLTSNSDFCTASAGVWHELNYIENLASSIVSHQ